VYKYIKIMAGTLKLDCAFTAVTISLIMRQLYPPN
jgi:hypothetical protein